MILEFIKTVLWNVAWVTGAVFGFAVGTAITELL